MSSRVAPAIPGLRAGAGPGRSGRGQRAGCGSGGEGRAKFGELGADLVGVGVVEVVQDRERFLPGRSPRPPPVPDQVAAIWVCPAYGSGSGRESIAEIT